MKNNEKGYIFATNWQKMPFLLFFFRKKHENNDETIPLILLGGYWLEQHRLQKLKSIDAEKFFL